MRWWIEGARINWELGVARLSGGYVSPVMQTFLNICREHFSAASGGAVRPAGASKPAKRGAKPGRKPAGKHPKKSRK